MSNLPDRCYGCGAYLEGVWVSTKKLLDDLAIFVEAEGWHLPIERTSALDLRYEYIEGTYDLDLLIFGYLLCLIYINFVELNPGRIWGV